MSALFLTDPPVWQTFGRRTELRWLRCAKEVATFARKNKAWMVLIEKKIFGPKNTLNDW